MAESEGAHGGRGVVGAGGVDNPTRKNTRILHAYLLLTGAQGRKVDFRSTLIVLASNLSQDILISEDNVDVEGTISPKTKAAVMEIIQRSYPPEDIVDIRLKEIQERLDDRRIRLLVPEETRMWLAVNGYDPRYGARPLQRLISKSLLNPLAMRIIRGEIRNGETAKVKLAEYGQGLEVEASHEIISEGGEVLGDGEIVGRME
ncbi:C-terminal, D2-small domain, of ClpB protein-domain-containing protein [Tirmania nivea]|nr:C-terminal, D2-small domain, of ClpB protein-domain-containing protein [Tirmania nivea]